MSTLQRLLVTVMVPFLVKAQDKTIGKVEIFDPRMETIVSKSAVIEILTDQMQWAEGPVWVQEGHYFLFSDPKQNSIFKWTKEEGVTPFLKPSGYTGLGMYSDEPGSNGLLINKQGELVACEHGDRRISRMNLKQGGKITIADHWGGKRFNSPNDICQHSNGTYYFTDPPYGLPDRERDTRNREIAQNAVYSIDTNGTVKQIISDLKKPNGIALSPEEDILYVAQSDGDAPHIVAYALQDGQLASQAGVLFDFKTQYRYGEAHPDGIKVDKAGNIYAAAGEGVVVLSAAGELLGRIYTGVATANCAFGADNFLYITASNYVLRIQLNPS